MVGVAKKSLADKIGFYIGPLMGLVLVGAFIVTVGSNIDIGGKLGTKVPFYTTQIEPNIDGNYYPLQYSEEDLFFMTQALYFEASTEPVECQQMVASVIMARMYDWHYPNTIQEVIWQPKQFSYTHDGKPEHMESYMAYQVAEEIAHGVLAGLTLDTTEGSLYYHNPKLVDWEYKGDYEFVVGCGDHDFYKRKGVKGWN